LLSHPLGQPAQASLQCHQISFAFGPKKRFSLLELGFENAMQSQKLADPLLDCHLCSAD